MFRLRKLILIVAFLGLSVFSCESPLSPEDSQEKQRICKLLTNKSWRMLYEVDPYMGGIYYYYNSDSTGLLLENYSSILVNQWTLVARKKDIQEKIIGKGTWALAKNESKYRYSPQEDWELTKKYEDGTESLEYVVNVSDTTLVLGTLAFHGLIKTYYEPFPK